MKKITSLIIGLLLCFGCVGSALADHNAPVILLDSGHSPKQKGAISVRGIYEVVYNDHFVTLLARMLRANSFDVRLTRQPNESISLPDRVAIANQLKPQLFLSIHHDSAQLIHLDKVSLGDRTVYSTKKRIAGYSIFVSRKNVQFSRSYLFAQQLGAELRTTGRRYPSLHHSEDIAGERRHLLDAKLGIYQFDDLIVLRKTNIPAVLLEVGVIVDREDEAHISDIQNQEQICLAIVNAIKQYFRQR